MVLATIRSQLDSQSRGDSCLSCKLKTEAVGMVTRPGNVGLSTAKWRDWLKRFLIRILQVWPKSTAFRDYAFPGHVIDILLEDSAPRSNLGALKSGSIEVTRQNYSCIVSRSSNLDEFLFVGRIYLSLAFWCRTSSSRSPAPRPGMTMVGRPSCRRNASRISSFNKRCSFFTAHHWSH